LWQRGFARLL